MLAALFPWSVLRSVIFFSFALAADHLPLGQDFLQESASACPFFPLDATCREEQSLGPVAIPDVRIMCHCVLLYGRQFTGVTVNIVSTHVDITTLKTN